MTTPPRKPSASMSLTFDELLTDEGLELTLTAKDDEGTQETHAVIPWDSPADTEPEPDA